jgi:hypothetical protein
MGDLLSGIASIFGATNADNQGNQDTQGLNQMIKQILPMVQTLTGFANNASTIGGLAQNLGGLSAGLASGLAPGLGSAYGGLLGAVNGTSRGAPGTAGGAYTQGMNFFGNEAQNGLSPQSIQAATGAFGQQQALQTSNALKNYTGTNNAGLLEDINLQGLQGAEGLGGQLAGLNQQAQTAGVQGGNALAQGTLGAINSAYGGYTGQGLAGYGTGLQGYQTAGGLTSAGINPLQGIAGMYGNAAQAAYGTANQDWQNAAQGIGNGLMSFLPGGQFASLFSGGGGGGGSAPNYNNIYAPGQQFTGGSAYGGGAGYGDGYYSGGPT